MLMGMNGLPAWMCLDYVCRAHGGQCRVLGPLELDLQMVLSHRVVAENQTQVACQSSKCSESQSFLKPPK